MHKLLLGLGLIPFIAMASPDFQHDNKCHDKERGKPHHELSNPDADRHFLKALDLTQTQQTEVKAIMDALRDKQQTNFELSQSLHQQLRQLAMSGDYQAQTADNVAQQISELNKASLIERSESMHQVFELLTETQKAKLAPRQTEKGRLED